jgi:hypothetical protein
VLSQEQRSRYSQDGFLDVTEPLLAVDEVGFVRERIDRLFDRWETVPRRMRDGNDDVRPRLARIYRVTVVDQAIAHCQLLETCREIASSIIGVRRAWCRFDSAIYKYPGAGSVSWHQDSALSTTRMSPHSVHFWIPLNDHASDSGCLVFLPGSHKNGAVAHHDAGGTGGVRKMAEPPDAAEVVSVPLSVGNLSLHSPLTIHGSDPNRGDTVRKAITLEFSAGPWSAARDVGRPLVSAMFVRSGAQSEKRRRELSHRG